MSIDYTKIRILLIEDEPDISLLAKTALNIKGFQVTSELNGEDGLASANENEYDLIILDISMPELDGYEVITKLKADDKTKLIPVLFFSAHVQKAEIEKGLALGALGYLKKPFDPVQFPDDVADFLTNLNIS